MSREEKWIMGGARRRGRRLMGDCRGAISWGVIRESGGRRGRWVGDRGKERNKKG
jgi:hypothetical protein